MEVAHHTAQGEGILGMSRNGRRTLSTDVHRKSRGGSTIKMPSGMLADKVRQATKFSPEEFLRAEERGREIRAKMNRRQDELKAELAKARITLPKVKGYWE